MKLLSIGPLIGALLLAAGSASATVVNFDDLRGDGPLRPAYAGIAWQPGWYYLDSAFPPFEAHSSPTRVYADADEKSFTFLGGDQVFGGAWFAGYYYVSFKLFNDGELVHESPTLELFGAGPAQFLASGYDGAVDTVTVVGVAGGYVMDDVTFGREVPEPGAPALVMAGLMAAGALRQAGRKGA